MESICINCDSRDFAHRVEKYAKNREDLTLFGTDYVALPEDADWVPINVGDVLDGYGKTIEVVEMRYGRSGWVLISRDGNGYADCAAFSHHHEPTVEDVLLEACKAYHGLMVESMSDVANDMPAPSEVIAEYAAKLALRGDE